MDGLSRALARLGPRGALPLVLHRGLRAASGFDQVLTGRRAITSFLDLPGVTVPYGPISRLLGLGAFPLALDGDDHLAARALIVEVLAGSAARHQDGVAAARTLATAQLAGATGPVDAISLVIDPGLARWVDTWFGLESGAHDLLGTSRAITRALFFNPAKPNGRTDAALLEDAAAAVATAVSDLIGPVSEASPGTVAGELQRLTGDSDLSARHLLGLTVGPLALGSWSIANVVADALGTPNGLATCTDDGEARRRFLIGIADNPPLPGVPRHNARLRRVLGREPLGLVTAPPGMVLSATTCAAHLDRPADPAEPDLAFGSGPHRCLGPELIADVAAAILAPLAVRRSLFPVHGPRAIEHAPPSYGMDDPFPFRLTIELA